MKHIAMKAFAAIGSAALMACAAFAPSLGIIKEDAAIVASAYSCYAAGCHWEYVQDIAGVAITRCRNYNSLQSLTIPSQLGGQNVMAIYNDAFVKGGDSNCQTLINVTVPNTVIHIGDNFFRNCDALQSISLPNSLLTMGNYCFYDADGLVNIEIPDSVKSIGSYFCNWAYGLQSATLGSGLEIIGAHSFARTPKLTTFNSYSCDDLETIREGILVNSKWEKDRANNDALYIGPSSKILLRYQRKNTNSYVELGNNVKILADKAFNSSSWTYGSYITQIVCPRVELIGDNVFGKVPNATVRLSATLMYQTYGNNWYNTVTAKVSPATFVQMH